MMQSLMHTVYMEGMDVSPGSFSAWRKRSASGGNAAHTAIVPHQESKRRPQGWECHCEIIPAGHSEREVEIHSRGGHGLRTQRAARKRGCGACLQTEWVAQACTFGCEIGEKRAS